MKYQDDHIIFFYRTTFERLFRLFAGRSVSADVQSSETGANVCTFRSIFVYGCLVYQWCPIL